MQSAFVLDARGDEGLVGLYAMPNGVLSEVLGGGFWIAKL